MTRRRNLQREISYPVFAIKLQVYKMENVYTKLGRSVFACLTLTGAI